jgi:hypothetical protein
MKLVKFMAENNEPCLINIDDISCAVGYKDGSHSGVRVKLKRLKPFVELNISIDDFLFKVNTNME